MNHKEQIKFFIMSIKDKKLREYLIKNYLDKDIDLKELDKELFMELNNIRQNRISNKYNRFKKGGYK